MPFQRKLWHQKIANKNIKIFLISQLLRSNTYLLKYFVSPTAIKYFVPVSKGFPASKVRRYKGLRPDRHFRLCACNHFEQRIYRANPLTSVDDKSGKRQMTHQPAGAYRGFCSMKRLGAILLPPGWDACESQSTRSESIAGCKCLYIQDPFQILHTVSSVM